MRSSSRMHITIIYICFPKHSMCCVKLTLPVRQDTARFRLRIIMIILYYFLVSCPSQFRRIRRCRRRRRCRFRPTTRTQFRKKHIIFIIRRRCRFQPAQPCHVRSDMMPHAMPPIASCRAVHETDQQQQQHVGSQRAERLVGADKSTQKSGTRTRRPPDGWYRIGIFLFRLLITVRGC